MEYDTLAETAERLPKFGGQLGVTEADFGGCQRGLAGGGTKLGRRRPISASRAIRCAGFWSVFGRPASCPGVPRVYQPDAQAGALEQVASDPPVARHCPAPRPTPSASSRPACARRGSLDPPIRISCQWGLGSITGTRPACDTRCGSSNDARGPGGGRRQPHWRGVLSNRVTEVSTILILPAQRAPFTLTRPKEPLPDRCIEAKGCFSDQIEASQWWHLRAA
jgi:hypothetical protein